MRHDLGNKSNEAGWILRCRATPLYSRSALLYWLLRRINSGKLPTLLMNTWQMHSFSIHSAAKLSHFFPFFIQSTASITAAGIKGPKFLLDIWGFKERWESRFVYLSMHFTFYTTGVVYKYEKTEEICTPCK